MEKMEIEAIIKNPICIRLGNNLNIIIENESGKIEHPLVPGVMFGGEHFGFILISETNGKQRETIYPTHRKIQAVGMNDSTLSIFEDGKEMPWLFERNGRIIHSSREDNLVDGITKGDILVRNPDLFTGDPLLLNPVRIKISENPEASKILGDNPGDIEYPLYPGAMLGGLHYGFIIIKEKDGKVVEKAYPTQHRIEAVGIEGGFYCDLKVFEEGKYHSWVFSFDGELNKESSYNPYSRKDVAFVTEAYGLKENNKDSFQLRKKKDE